MTRRLFIMRSTRDSDVLVPLYSSVAIGIEADHRLRGWGTDIPWSLGLAIGVATRVAGPVMASIELPAMNAYPRGIPIRIVSSRAGIRYAPAETMP